LSGTHHNETWTIDERIRLVQALCNSLAGHEIAPALTTEMKAELDRRIEDLDCNRDRERCGKLHRRALARGSD
jgi:putative addiction module component (TIGR02574 family)